MRISTTLLVLLCACTGDDKGDGSPSSAPVVQLLSPAEGSRLRADAPLTWRAAVSDDRQPPEDLTLAWTVDGATIDGETSWSGEEVELLLPAGLPAGEHALGLAATDSGGETGQDEISVVADDNAVPRISFLVPSPGEVLPAGRSSTLIVQVEDADEASLADLRLSWASEELDLSGAPAGPDADGMASLELLLEEGSPRLQVAVTDSAGDSASIEQLLEVVPTDADGDGHEDAAWGGGDCDDADPAVHPDQAERCDGLDNNCDGEIDEDSAEDALEWWVDADADGYGQPGETRPACALPDGYAGNDLDCDDSTADISPDQAERCDGGDVDEDCDGLSDDADDGATELAPMYADLDEDGWGDEGSSLLACDPGPLQSASPGDCDDADPALHPGAPEVCNELDDDCDGDLDELDADLVALLSWYPDGDGDGHGASGPIEEACDAPPGHVATGDDCDDADADISPSEPERCDGEDQDCDGTADDDPVDGTTWYPDSDRDGYGDSALGTRSCSRPSGWRSNGGDCDDSDATIKPGGTERCDGSTDEDCDGLVDDADSSVTGTSAWYPDADGDGYGALGGAVAACLAPTGYLASGADCDDNDVAISPTASEVCDGEDNDCDGLTDDDDAVAGPRSTWYRDVDGDGHGRSTTTTSACSLPSGYSATADDCDDTRSAVSPSASERCSTTYDDDCDSSANEDGAADCTNWWADLDGDGVGGTELCACASRSPYTLSAGGDCDDNDADRSPLEVEVCEDGDDQDCSGVDDRCTPVGETPLSAADLVVLGSSAISTFGARLAPLGDLDGDGTAEVGLSAPDQSQGVLAIWSGAELGAASSAAVSTAEVLLYGRASGDDLGHALAGGCDADGDGLSELLVGSPLDDGGATSAGAAFLWQGMPPAGAWTASGVSDHLWTAATASDQAGSAVALLGLWTATEDCTLALGAPGQDAGGSGAGAVYLQHGLPTSSGSHALTDTDQRLIGEDASDAFGTAAVDAGDMDGDGLSDLAVGAPGEEAGGTGAGAVYLFYGGASGAFLDATDADRKRTGESASDAAGAALAGVGDVDGDGLAELLVGARYDDDGGTNAGAAYLIEAGSTTTASLSTAMAKLRGDAASAGAGAAVGAVGDMDGDGYAEIMVGAADDRGGGTSAGLAAFWWGPVSGSQALSSATATFAGEAAYDYAGTAVGGLGDLNGDGRTELAVGAPYNDRSSTNAGAVFVFFGGVP